jgi:hypothetical protein
MTDNEKKVLNGFLQKTLNLDTEALAGLYNEAGELIDLSTVLEKDAERVAKFNKKSTDQYGRGLKEGAGKIEKEIKEKYEIDSELIGVELIDHLLETKTTELTSKFEDLKKSKLKDDEIEKHPKYMQLKLEHDKQLKVKDKEWEDKFKAKEAEFSRKETFDKVSKQALLFVDSGFVLPEKAERAAALKDVLVKELQGENFNIQDDGTIILLDKDNKMREDAHGKPISFKDYVDGMAVKYFDKREANARGNAGNKNEGQSGDSQMTFKNRDEMLAAQRELEKENIPEDEKRAKRIKIMQATIK